MINLDVDEWFIEMPLASAPDATFWKLYGYLFPDLFGSDSLTYPIRDPLLAALGFIGNLRRQPEFVRCIFMTAAVVRPSKISRFIS